MPLVWKEDSVLVELAEHGLSRLSPDLSNIVNLAFTILALQGAPSAAGIWGSLVDSFLLGTLTGKYLPQGSRHPQILRDLRLIQKSVGVTFWWSAVGAELEYVRYGPFLIKHIKIRFISASFVKKKV